MKRIGRKLIYGAAAYAVLWGLTAGLGVPAAKAAAGAGDQVLAKCVASCPAPFIVRAELEYLAGNGNCGTTGVGTYVWVLGWCRQVDWAQGWYLCG